MYDAFIVGLVQVLTSLLGRAPQLTGQNVLRTAPEAPATISLRVQAGHFPTRSGRMLDSIEYIRTDQLAKVTLYAARLRTARAAVLAQQQR
jgi:hypothetical protein